MASPAAPGVDFDRNRIGQGELIAGISGLVLLIDLWFKWYGVKFSGGGGLLKGFNIGVSATAWQVFSLIDIILFLVALIAIGVAVMRGLNRLPDMPYPPATLVAAAGGLAVLLILFRLIDTPVDTHGAPGVDVTRKFGVFLGLLSAIGVAYGGWRAMQDSGASFGDLSRGAGAGGGPGAGPGPSAPTTPMPAGGGAAPGGAPGGGAPGSPGVPGGGAAGVSPGKEGPGAPHPGTSTGAPGGDDAPAASAAPDPIPGQTAGGTPAGLAGEPPAGGGTTPPGIAGDRGTEGGPAV